MRITSPREYESVVRLKAADRYSHFVKRIVDEEQVWGVWREDWILMTDDSGSSVFPLWPAREYAAAMCIGEWEGLAPKPISLEALTGAILSSCLERGIKPAVFPTPAGLGVVPTVDELRTAIAAEKTNYP